MDIGCQDRKIEIWSCEMVIIYESSNGIKMTLIIPSM